MAQPYRNAHLVCPLCAADLEATQVGEATIDVCPQCQGIWVDWFDGDLPSIAREVRLKGAEAGQGGDSRCPLCREALAAEVHLEAEVLRCAACSGVFVPRPSVDVLLEARDPSEPKEDGLEGVLDRIQRFFGLGGAGDS